MGYRRATVGGVFGSQLCRQDPWLVVGIGRPGLYEGHEQANLPGLPACAARLQLMQIEDLLDGDVTDTRP